MTWTLVGHRGPGHGRRYSAVVVFLRLSYQKKIIITMISIRCPLLYMFYLLKWSRNTDLIKYRNYWNEFNGRDQVLINALFATHLAWQIASSELIRVLVLITSQPVISFLSSNLSTNSESFYCFQYLFSIIKTDLKSW